MKGYRWLLGFVGRPELRPTAHSVDAMDRLIGRSDVRSETSRTVGHGSAWRIVRPVLVASIVAVAVFSCSRDLPEPSGTVAQSPPGVQRYDDICSARCTLVESAQPLALAIARSDSANSMTLLAEIHATGVAGDGLSLVTLTDDSLRSFAGSAALVVETNGVRTEFPMRGLPDSVHVFTFARTGTVDVKYWLRRGARKSGDAVLRLTQITSGARITSSFTPWHQQRVRPRLTGPTCQITTMTGTCDSTSWSGTPFVVGSPWGSGDTFTSNGSFNASDSITITFSKPVSKAVIEIDDPTWAGNYARAYDSTGTKIDSVLFTGNNTPGTNTPDTDSLSGRIFKIVLHPNDSDYVAYRMWITPVPKPKIVIIYAAGTDTTGGKAQLIPLNDALEPPSAGSRVLSFKVRIDSGGVSLPSRTVSMVAIAVDSGGIGSDSVYGHVHFSGTKGLPKPIGTLSSTSISTDTGTSATVTFTSSTTSGPVILRASITGADTVRRTVVVTVTGLGLLTANGHDSLIGFTTIHPSSHSGTSTMRSYMGLLADTFFVQFRSRKLAVNDLSLPKGGLLDILDTALWSPPHRLHRYGKSADVRILKVDASDVPILVGGNVVEDTVRRVFLKEQWYRISGHVAAREGKPIHLHLQYR